MEKKNGFFSEIGRLSCFIEFSEDFTLFVIDIHQIMLILLFPIPFDHFYSHPTLGLKWTMNTLAHRSPSGCWVVNNALPSSRSDLTKAESHSITPGVPSSSKANFTFQCTADVVRSWSDTICSGFQINAKWQIHFRLQFEDIHESVEANRRETLQSCIELTVEPILSPGDKHS